MSALRLFSTLIPICQNRGLSALAPAMPMIFPSEIAATPSISGDFRQSRMPRQTGCPLQTAGSPHGHMFGSQTPFLLQHSLSPAGKRMCCFNWQPYGFKMRSSSRKFATSINHAPGQVSYFSRQSSMISFFR